VCGDDTFYVSWEPVKCDETDGVGETMLRSLIVLLAICFCGSIAQAKVASDVTTPTDIQSSVPPAKLPTAPLAAPVAVTAASVASDLPDSPGVRWSVPSALNEDRYENRAGTSAEKGLDFDLAPSLDASQSHAPPPLNEMNEHYHWKGLLLQSFAFMMLEDGVRIITADQHDRHLLLNKPFWSDYWASLQQFNMRRWNDGDSIPVNYVGHPLQGAISGYIEVQNDPRGRDTIIGRDPAYWKSVWRATLWSTVYSTESEIGPFGEAAFFNEGGFTYAIGCDKKNYATCSLTAKYTNNTGWVDFIITPVVGTLWMLGEDTLDKYISNPLVRKHPHALGYKILRGGLNPPRSLANLLRGEYPWYRDYEHPGVYESPIVEHFDRAMQAEPHDHVDLFLYYTALSLNVNAKHCSGCRRWTTGAGMEYGFAVRRYLDLVVATGIQPSDSEESSLNIGGTLWTGNIGVRSGYSGKHFALKFTLAPGFASYSRTLTPSSINPDPTLGRNYNFSMVGAISTDVRFTSHLAFRVKTEQMVIRYKSLDRDPPGIGTPPRLSFLSHDNYINSTNWGVNIGPVIRF
jgi:hypothetical protein